MLAIVSLVVHGFVHISGNKFSFKSLPDVLGKYKALLDMPMRPILMWLGLAKAMSAAALAGDLLGRCQEIKFLRRKQEFVNVGIVQNVQKVNFSSRLILTRVSDCTVGATVGGIMIALSSVIVQT